MIGPKELSEVVKGAEQIGALQASGVWAIFCAWFMWRDYRREKTASEDLEKQIESRNKLAEASAKNAEAINEVSEKSVQMLIVLSEVGSTVRELNRRIKCLGG